MKKKNALALILVVLAVSGVASLQASQRRTPAAEASDRPRIDIESYTMDVTIKPTEHILHGVVEIKLRQLERTPYIILDLDSRLRIDKLTLDGAEARFRQYDLDGTVEISTTGGQLSDVSTLRFEYEGFLDPPPGNRRAAVLSSISENGAYLLYESKWFPVN
jgi:aminopeptidase N